MPLYIIPQNAYHPTGPFTCHRLATFRVSNSFIDGVRVTHIKRDPRAASALLGAQDPAFTGMRGTKASLRILWPGYPLYSHQINIRCFRDAISTGFTVEQAVKALAAEIIRAFETISIWQCAPDGWPLGLHGIRVEQIFLIGVDRVSPGSIQPILAIELPDVVGLEFATAG